MCATPKSLILAIPLAHKLAREVALMLLGPDREEVQSKRKLQFTHSMFWWRPETMNYMSKQEDDTADCR